MNLSKLYFKHFLLLFLCSLPLAGHTQPKLTELTLKEDGDIEISGSSFGAGPNVIFFANFDKQEKFLKLLSSLNSTLVPEAPLLKEASGNIVHRAKDLAIAQTGQKGLNQIIVDFKKVYTEMFVSFSVKVPPNSTFAGASSARTFPNMSTWKFTWLMLGKDGSENRNNFDICLPSHTGNGSFLLGGNDGTLAWLKNGSTWWDWDDFNHMSSYIRFDPENPNQGSVDYSWSVTNQRTQIEQKGTAPVSKFSSTNNGFDRIRIPGWWGNGSNERFDGVYDNIYIAVGENSLARVVITDNEDISKSHFSIVALPKVWSGSKIVIDGDVIPPGSFHYIHIYDQNGKLSGSPLKICPRCPKMPQL